MSEEIIIKNCSPTLAGIKTGNIFLYRQGSRKGIEGEIQSLSDQLAPYGVQVRLLRRTERGSLVYVFRPERLTGVLAGDKVRGFLKGYGYRSFDAEDCIQWLSHRLRQGEDFPHEIGVFLDYPLEDIRGFIANGGRGSKCVGCWKVYGDAQKAQATFRVYKSCTRKCLYKKGLGMDLEEIAAHYQRQSACV